MNIRDIKPYSNNAKKHPKKQVEQVAASIKEFGFNQPIVVDKNNVIIVGHGRLEAAKLLGLNDVPVITIDLTPEQANAYRLADNKLNESEWDMNLVIEELKGLSEPMLELTGFDKDLIIEPDEKDDEVPEVPEEPQSKLGDLYELGNHRVLCGDSTKLEDVERLMDGKKADMVFTDPPYGMNLQADFHWSKGNKDMKIKPSKGYSQVIGDDKDFDASFIFDLFGYCKEMFLWGGDYFIDTLPNFGKDGGWIVWDKKNDDLKNVWTNEFELCWSKMPHKREVLRVLWNGALGTESEDIKRRVHPTQKPTRVCEPIIKDYSDEKSVVVDLFLGSGSTLIASEKTGRICYGMELDPKYIDVIVQRYVDYIGNATIKKNGEEIVWIKTPNQTPTSV